MSGCMLPVSLPQTHPHPHPHPRPHPHPNPQHRVDVQVTLAKNKLLDPIFDEAGTVGAIDDVGDPPPEEGMVRIHA